VHGDLNPEDENFVALLAALNERVDAYNRLVMQRRGIMAAEKDNSEEITSSSSFPSVSVVA
jgi:hypothetical protein